MRLLNADSVRRIDVQDPGAVRVRYGYGNAFAADLSVARGNPPETWMRLGNVTPTRRTLTTLVTYTRPWLGRLVMTIIRPAHRRLARRRVASPGPARVNA